MLSHKTRANPPRANSIDLMFSAKKRVARSCSSVGTTVFGKQFLKAISPTISLREARGVEQQKRVSARLRTVDFYGHRARQLVIMVNDGPVPDESAPFLRTFSQRTTILPKKRYNASAAPAMRHTRESQKRETCTRVCCRSQENLLLTGGKKLNFVLRKIKPAQKKKKSRINMASWVDAELSLEGLQANAP